MRPPVDVASRVRLAGDGPVAVGLVAWTRPTGEGVVSVVAKVTFALAPGACTLVEPDPILHRDVHWLGDPRRSLAVASDAAPFKPGAEVTISGSAYAVHDVARVCPRLVVGSVDKSLEAWVPRRWSSERELVAAAPQRVFPLAWEWAAGGPETDNPVGVQRDGSGRVAGLQSLDARLATASDDLVPVGFGPVAPTWPSRRRLLSAEQDQWARGASHAPQPEGFDPRWFMSAPPDQWLDAPLPPDAMLVLEHLHPEHPRLVTCLPGLLARMFVWSPHERMITLQPDTLHLDTDRGVGTLTYRTTFAPTGRCVATVTLRRGDEVIEPAERRRLHDLHASEPVRTDVEHTAADGVRAAGAALPFDRARDASEPVRPVGVPPAPTFGAPTAIAAQGSAAQGSAPLVAPPLVGQVAAPPIPLVNVTPVHVEAPRPPVPPLPVFAKPPSAPEPRPVDEPPSMLSKPAAAPRSMAASRRAPRRGSAEVPERRRLVDLLHHEPGVISRLTRAGGEEHAELALLRSTSDRTAGVSAGDEQAERMRILRFMSCARATPGADLAATHRTNLASPSLWELPLYVLEGELSPSFDDAEQLRAAMTIAQGVGGADKRVASLVAQGEALLAGVPNGEAISALQRQIESAVASLALAPKLVERAVEQAMLEGRKYRVRGLFGGSQVRCTLSLARFGRLPAYLPAAAASRLPALPKFDVVVLAELRPREDAIEADKHAFAILALARRLDGGEREDAHGTS